MKQLRPWLVLGLLVLSLLAVMTLMESARQDQESGALTLSPGDSGRGGGRALWLLCQEHGARVAQHYGIRDLPEDGVVIWRDSEEADAGPLLDWVRKGGHLVVLPTDPRSDLMHRLGIDYLPPGISEAHPRLIPWGKHSVAVRWEGGELKKCRDGHPILTAGSSIQLAEVQLERGDIQVLGDAWPLSNDGLDAASNGDFALWLLKVRPGSQVVYTEPEPTR
ncbi:MAG: DUF4350 domain-containing protein, partial [Candidatus Xenobia bacterium]